MYRVYFFLYETHTKVWNVCGNGECDWEEALRARETRAIRARAPTLSVLCALRAVNLERKINPTVLQASVGQVLREI